MDKSEDAFRTISEAADELDLPQHVLRFWETRFTQIRPMKRGGGRRYYRPDDVALLRTIRHLLYNEGYTIRGVQRMLKERGVRAVLAMGEAGSKSAPGPAPRAVELASEPEPARNEAAFMERESAPLHAPVMDTSRISDIDERERPAPSHTQAAPLAPRPPSWTRAQRQALESIAAELAECRRILTAASI